TPLPTTFVSATQLTFTIPVDLVKDAAVSSITVRTLGLTNSNAKDFPILTVQLTGFTGATTTYVSLNQLKVSVPASAIAVPGQYVLRVQSPGATPGAPPILSPQAPVFTVTAPGPAITGLTPASVLAGGAAFTLTVTGRNFVPT